MTVQLFASTDASAPVLTGQNGSLVALLDACLVNGYGSKSGAGWSIAYTTTNKRAYRQATSGGNSAGLYCYIDDTGPGGGAGREARVCGFETMSAITPVGTGQFPNSTQSSIGAGYLVIRKSNTNDATARKWYVIADQHTFYLFVEIGDNNAPNLTGDGFMFGDFESYKSGDAYAVMIIGRTRENTGDPRGGNISLIPGAASYGVNNNLSGHFIARHWNQSAVSVRAGKLFDSSRTNMTSSWAGDNSDYQNEGGCAPGFCNDSQRAPFPNPVDGAMWMAPFYVNQNGIRGYLRGLWGPMHQWPLNPGDTFTVGSGELSGKSFVATAGVIAIPGGPQSRPTQFFVEFSDTWP